MRLMLLAVILALVGCGGDRSETVKAENRPAPAEAPASRSTVQMDPAAQREANLVISPVTVRQTAEALAANGRLTWNEDRTWHVGAITEGRVVKVLANAGDPVRAGQVLARIHSHDVHEIRAEYQKAKQELSRQEANVAVVQRARDRARRLLELKAGSLEAAELAETELRTLQAAITAARIEVERARTHLEEFLGLPAEDPGHAGGTHDPDADYIPVRAPHGGLIVSRAVSPGSVVAVAAEMFHIADASSLWLLAAVPESEIARVRVGMAVQVRVPAFPGQVFPGRVARLGEQLDPATRTLPVRVTVPNAGQRLKPEMYASAALAEGKTQTSLAVPSAAVQEVNGQSVVFVRVAPDRFETRAVQLGPSEGDLRTVLEGLRAGESVVTRGSFTLKSELLKSSLAEEE